MPRPSLPNGVSVGTISHGTLRPQDLIPKFLDVIGKLNPDRLAEINRTYEDVAKTGYAPTDDMTVDELGEFEIAIACMMDELWDSFDTFLPQGYAFGPNEGDGSDFGIWEDPEFEDDSDDDSEEDNTLPFRG